MIEIILYHLYNSSVSHISLQNLSVLFKPHKLVCFLSFLKRKNNSFANKFSLNNNDLLVSPPK